ncbi:MAG: nicotinate (nicotinamide) nucleotide adenylyltransferase [Verrucomicrobiota bacterium]
MPDARTGDVPEPRKIALFGGTFDPVHLGHRHVAEEAVKAMGLDEVRFIPCRISPHKEGSLPASAEDRLAMLRLAMVDAPWAVADDLELRRDGPSFSYETAELMRERFPAAKLYWIMGADQWEALTRWKNPERLAQCVEFIVIDRGDIKLSPHGFAMHLIKTHHPASATKIREALARGEKNQEWLHPDVAKYIRIHRLYGA